MRKDVEEYRLSEISEKAKVRLLGGGPEDIPSAPPPPNPPRQAAPSTDPAPPPLPPKSVEPIFLSDAAEGADVLEAALIVHPLAQLCVTEQVQTPFIAAIAGPPGAGKTFALRRLAQMIENLTGSAGALARVVVARVDASDG